MSKKARGTARVTFQVISVNQASATMVGQSYNLNGELTQGEVFIQGGVNIFALEEYAGTEVPLDGIVVFKEGEMPILNEFRVPGVE